MTAFLSLPSGYKPSSEDHLAEVLKLAGIEDGIDWPALATLILQGPTSDQIAVAHGTPPQPGEDAYIEHLFEVPGVRLVEKAGRVNWRESHQLPSVKAGDAVLRRHPSRPGKPGVTVRGKRIDPKPPKECRWPLGKGVAISPDDPQLALAEVSGVVRVDSYGKVTVDDTYVVEGDVSLRTGNLDVTGSVLVRGDIRSGFSVKATGDVRVNGVIDKATVEAGGSVVVDGAIFGRREVGPIVAGLNIVASFADNAELRAGGDVLLAQEAVNCDIVAEGRIRIGAEVPTEGSITGGSAQAATDIVVFNLGSDEGHGSTKVRVGFDWLLPGKLAVIDEELDSCQARLKGLKDEARKLLIERSRGNVNTEQRLRTEQVKSEMGALNTQITDLTERRERWVKAAEVEVSVAVHGRAMATTEIVVNGSFRELTEDRERERFTCENNTVKGVPLNDS